MFTTNTSSASPFNGDLIHAREFALDPAVQTMPPAYRERVTDLYDAALAIDQALSPYRADQLQHAPQLMDLQEALQQRLLAAMQSLWACGMTPYLDRHSSRPRGANRITLRLRPVD